MLPSSLPRRVGWQADPGSILTDNLCTPRRRHGSTSTSASSSPRWSYAGVPSCIPSSLSKFVVCLLDLFSGMQMKYIPLAQSLVSPLWVQGIFFLLPCSSSPASFPHPSDMGQQCCTSLACFSSVLARPELCLMFDSVVWLVLLFPGLIFLYTTTMIFLVVLPPVNCGGKIIFYQEKWIHYICAWESAFVYQ